MSPAGALGLAHEDEERGQAAPGSNRGAATAAITIERGAPAEDKCVRAATESRGSERGGNRSRTWRIAADGGALAHEQRLCRHGSRRAAAPRATVSRGNRRGPRFDDAPSGVAKRVSRRRALAGGGSDDAARARM